jgi:hypothetical protein
LQWSRLRDKTTPEADHIRAEAKLSDSDSFIEEVNEEVRRDRLFKLLRKYGWIPVSLVVVVVAVASWIEWERYQERLAAERLGDAVLGALSASDAKARADAIGAIGVEGDSTTVLSLLQAAAEAEASDRDRALQILDGLAVRSDLPQLYTDLAALKAVILRGADQDRTARMAALDLLSEPGRPYRLIALEQKALALYEFGNNDEAIAVLLAILDEPQATQGLLQRAQQLIVAMGGTLPNGGTAATENG